MVDMKKTLKTMLIYKTFGDVHAVVKWGMFVKPRFVFSCNQVIVALNIFLFSETKGFEFCCTYSASHVV